MPSLLVRAGALVALVAVTLVAAFTIPLPDLQELRGWVVAAGPAAPIVFVLGYAVAVLAPVPKSVLTTLAGVAFGIPLGVPLVVAGATLGAVGAFGTARLLGRDAVSRYADRYAHGRLQRVDALLARHGTWAVLIVRFVPVMPFTLLNYACGVTGMRLRHYTLGTAVALVPGTTAMVALGSAGGRISPWVPIGISVTAIGLSLLGGGGWLLRRRRRPQAPISPRVVSPSQ
jgi:LPXTG-motif cell wall-anchored protein